jgi:ArsR family metal-binding transcriptional regulator
MPLVTRLAIIGVVPCLADTAKIRVTAELDADIGDVLPYLNTTLKNAIYNARTRTLTVRKEGMLFTLRRNTLTGTKLRDVDHVRIELERLIATINETWERRSDITPSFERREQPTVLEIYRRLAATNCRQCGENTCLAFAAKLVAERVTVVSCAPLFTPEWREQRIALVELLEATGYSVPSVFVG